MEQVGFLIKERAFRYFKITLGMRNRLREKDEPLQDTWLQSAARVLSAPVHRHREHPTTWEMVTEPELRANLPSSYHPGLVLLLSHRLGLDTW